MLTLSRPGFVIRPIGFTAIAGRECEHRRRRDKDYQRESASLSILMENFVRCLVAGVLSAMYINGPQPAQQMRSARQQADTCSVRHGGNNRVRVIAGCGCRLRWHIPVYG